MPNNYFICQDSKIINLSSSFMVVLKVWAGRETIHPAPLLLLRPLDHLHVQQAALGAVEDHHAVLRPDHVDQVEQQVQVD